MVYEALARDKKYIEDVRGVREHNRHGNNKKLHANGEMESMDAFGAALKQTHKKKAYRT